MKTFCKLTTQSPATSYVPLPRFLLQDEALRDISNDAKVLYALLLDRASISRQNGYVEPNGTIQQQGIEDFGVVADVPQRFVLQQKPWKRHIGCRWAIGGKLTECFHLTSCPIHLIPLRIDWIDG